MRKQGWIILISVCLMAGCGSQTADPMEDEMRGMSQAAESSEVSVRPEDTQAAEAYSEESADEEISWQHISQKEAKRIMEEEDGIIILDVRTYSEYNEGHIPGAICIPNESIGTEEIRKLPDKDQKILVYCRSGRRSIDASEKLAALGYTNILEFGGILDWTGDVVTKSDEKEKSLYLMINDREMPVIWEDNASVEALKELTAENELVISMSMYGGFEQVGPLGTEIPRDDEQTTTEAGDIVLYSGSQIVVFYGSNSWAYTRIGHIDLSAEEITELLGGENVILKLRIQKQK